MENSNEIAQQDIGLKHAVFPGKRAKPIRQSMLAAAVHRPHGLLVARDRLRAIHSPTPTATMVSTEPSTPIMESCSLDGAIQKNKPRHESRRCHGEKIRTLESGCRRSVHTSNAADDNISDDNPAAVPDGKP